jgi:hypothetical protein
MYEAIVLLHYYFDIYKEQSVYLLVQPMPPVLLITIHFSVTAGNARHSKSVSYSMLSGASEQVLFLQANPVH